MSAQGSDLRESQQVGNGAHHSGHGALPPHVTRALGVHAHRPPRPQPSRPLHPAEPWHERGAGRHWARGPARRASTLCSQRQGVTSCRSSPACAASSSSLAHTRSTGNLTRRLADSFSTAMTSGDLVAMPASSTLHRNTIGFAVSSCLRTRSSTRAAQHATRCGPAAS